MKRMLHFLLLFLVYLPLSAFDHDYSDWSALLSTHVKKQGPISSVDYGSLKKQKLDIDKIAAAFSKVDKKDFKSWSERKQLAFLINAYNVFTIQLITEHYPVDSIKSTKITWLSPFKKEFFKLFGKSMSLGYLEHEILRKDYNEARIHFAINCASIGCPALLDEAFVGSKLDTQLELVSKEFANDTTRNRLSKKDSELQVSKIFDWFEADFKRDFGSVKAFFLKYKDLSDEEKALLESDKIKLDYLDYDWKLNETK